MPRQLREAEALEAAIDALEESISENNADDNEAGSSGKGQADHAGHPREQQRERGQEAAGNEPGEGEGGAAADSVNDHTKVEVDEEAEALDALLDALDAEEEAVEAAAVTMELSGARSVVSVLNATPPPDEQEQGQGQGQSVGQGQEPEQEAHWAALLARHRPYQCRPQPVHPECP